MQDPASILVIRRDNIGDLICTTPLLRALRRRFPSARIDALVNSYNRPVLANNPDVDHVYAYTKAKHREAGETVAGVHWRRLNLMLELRRRRYDLAILANDGDTARALKLAGWIKPRRVAAFVAAGAGRDPRIDLAVETDRRPRHAVEIAFRLVALLGIEGEPPGLRLAPGAQELAAARAQLAQQAWFEAEAPTLAIHISARKVQQRWPAERFAELMRQLHAAYGAQFLLFWAPGDESNPLHPGDDRKAEAILAACRGLPVLAYPTAHLDQLIAGIAVCDAMICSDGGAMHVGAGLGKPIVCFFGNSDAVRWRPWGVRHELLQKPSLDVNDIAVEEALAAYGRLVR